MVINMNVWIFFSTFLNTAMSAGQNYNFNSECPVSFDQLTTETEFGHNMLKYFQFEPGYVNLNHGSFGATPKLVMECLRYWQNRAEQNPDKWLRYELGPRLQRAAETMAAYLGVKDSRDVAFIPNVSSGINGIVRSLKLNTTDVMLYFSEAYGSVKLTIRYAASFRDALVHEIKVKFPFTTKEILESLENVLLQFPNRVRLISISHIGAVPAILFPVKEITEMGRKYNAYVLIDGAHDMGQIAVNLTELDPDFYVASGHKWFFSSRGSAVMYVKKDLQWLIHPTVISWGYNQGFQPEFHQQGTLDYSTFLTFPAALEFRRRLGDNRIMKYTSELAKYAREKLSSAWGTPVLMANDDLSMINIRLPLNSSIVVHTVVERLLLSHSTFMATFTVKDADWYARISAQIYNEKPDFDYLAENLLSAKQLLENPVVNAYPYCINKKKQ